MSNASARFDDILHLILSLDAEIWIALAATLLAIFALVLIVLQDERNYIHHKLSVRPCICTKKRTNTQYHTAEVTLELINCGVGPALIKNFVFFYEDQEISRNNLKSYQSFIKQNLSGFNDVHVASYLPGSVLEINQNYLLLKFQYNPKKHDVSFIHKLNLLVEYQSIYQDDLFIYDSRKDSSFHNREDLSARRFLSKLNPHHIQKSKV